MLALRYDAPSHSFLVAMLQAEPLSATDATFLRQRLLRWFADHRREMPWRSDRSLYRVWVAEVMLQQTRVDQATPYFVRFIAAFPDVESLARADLDDVLRLWEGLGYYARARHLHAAARQVVDRYQGAIPEDYDGFRSLPGVGPYTAAAVLSIACDAPYAAVDGNVIRVLTRLFGIADDVRQASTRNAITAQAQSLLDPSRPGAFNEALMELGATVCTPNGPDCLRCPLSEVCYALQSGAPTAFPFKSARGPTPHFDVALGIVSRAPGEVLIQRRAEEGLLGGLWEFPGGKLQPGETLEEACVRELREELGIDVQVDAFLEQISHAYSHFKVTLHAFRCRLRAGEPRSAAGLPVRWASLDTLGEYAFPRANRRLIDLLLSAPDARETL